MKNLIFNLNSKFYIEGEGTTQLFELESNVSKIIFECEPLEGFTYRLHKMHNGIKEYVVLDVTEDGVECALTNSFLNDSGIYYLQMSASNDTQQIISNTIQLKVGKFINATGEVPEEKINEIDALLIKAEQLSSLAVDLSTFDVTEIENGVRISYKGVNYDIYNAGGEGGVTKQYVDNADAQLQNSINQLADSTAEVLEDKVSLGDFEDFEDNFNDFVETTDINLSSINASILQLISELNTKQIKLIAGDNITLTADGHISATGGGEGGVSKNYVDTQDNGIKTYLLGIIQSDEADIRNIEADINTINTALDGKQKLLKAGRNIVLSSDGTISATTGELPDNVITDEDFASNTDAGIVRVRTLYALSIDSEGSVSAQVKDTSGYSLLNSSAFISKGTLENVLTPIKNSIPSVVMCTQAEYDAMTTHDPNTLYVIKG